VHIGARVCALAAPGEILVTSTVKTSSTGSGINFTTAERQTLKGIPTNGETSPLSMTTVQLGKPHPGRAGALGAAERNRCRNAIPLEGRVHRHDSVGHVSGAGSDVVCASWTVVMLQR